jgi:hypothetical protein
VPSMRVGINPWGGYTKSFNFLVVINIRTKKAQKGILYYMA